MTECSSRKGPVIIIGAARSGTKFLRDVLATYPGFAAIPYDVSYVWRSGHEDCPHDALEPNRLDPSRIASIHASLARLAGLAPGDTRCLLEKTVGNTLRVPYVHRVFSDARLVILIRDGRAVTESAMRCWQEPTDVRRIMQKLSSFPWRSSYRYALWFLGNRLASRGSGRKLAIWGPRYPGIEKDCEELPLHQICARQWRYSVDLTSRSLMGLPVECYHILRYEDLVADDRALSDLLAFLGIADGASVVERFRQTCTRENSEAWRDRLAPDILAEIETECGETLARWGYERSPPMRPQPIEDIPA